MVERRKGGRRAAGAQHGADRIDTQDNRDMREGLVNFRADPDIRQKCPRLVDFLR